MRDETYDAIRFHINQLFVEIEVAFEYNGQMTTRYHDSIVTQLEAGGLKETSTGGTGNKKRPPASLEPIDLLAEIRDAYKEYLQRVGDASDDLRSLEKRLSGLVHRGRVLLGYDEPDRTLQERCEDCGAQFRVRADATGDVWCTGCPVTLSIDAWTARYVDGEI